MTIDYPNACISAKKADDGREIWNKDTGGVKWKEIISYFIEVIGSRRRK